MTPKTQSRFALILTLLFVIVAPIMILYAFGYRITPPEQGFRVGLNPTGGLRVSTRAPYTVTLNGESLQTSPVFRLGLNPGQAQVTLSEPGFQSWEKNLTIEPYLVTLIDSAILFPDTPTTTPIPAASDVTQIIANPLSNNILYVSESDRTPGLWIYNPQTSTTTQLVDSLEINGSTTQKYQDITWDESGQQIIFRANILNQDAFFIISNALSQDSAVTNISDLFPYDLDLAPVQIVELTGNTLTFIQGGHIFQIDLVEQKRSDILVSDVAVADQVGNTIYYANTKEQDIRAFNTLALTETTLTSFPPETSVTSILVPPTETHMILFGSDEQVFWKNLTSDNLELRPLEEVLASRAIFGAEGKKALLVGKNEVNILYLDVFDGYQKKSEGDLDLIYTSEQDLQQVRYFGPTQEHITFVENGQLMATELDTRSTPNTYTLLPVDNYSDVIVGNQAIFIVQTGDMIARFEFPFRRGLF